MSLESVEVIPHTYRGGKVYHADCAICGHRTQLQCRACKLPVCVSHYATHLCLPGKWTLKVREECGALII